MFLVTGGSGFCGFEIVRHLTEHGQTVRVLDVVDLPTPIEGVQLIKGDIRDKKVVEDACRGIHRVIHTVAKVPISKAGKGFQEVNVQGTENILAAAVAAGVQKVVHISSSAVQCLDSAPIDETAPYRTVDPYAYSKMQGELVCKRFQDRLSIDIIRPRTVLGMGRLGLFSIFFDWISKGLNVYLIGKGDNTLQFIHVEDLAACVYQSSLVKGSFIFNVGSKTFGTLREDIQALVNHAGTGSRVVSLPVTPTILGLRLLDFFKLSPLAPWHYLTYHKNFYVTNRRAKDILKWEPRYGNREILISAYDSFLKNQTAPSRYGVTHRTTLKQGILEGINKTLSRKHG